MSLFCRKQEKETEMKVHVMTQGSSIPNERPSYIVGRNGMYLALSNTWVDAVVPVKELKVLDSVIPSINLKLPPLPKKMVSDILSFFRIVNERYSTEAAVLLHYSAKDGWLFTVPKQQVTPNKVSYAMEERLEGYQCFGTMHSHGEMGAWHSMTDVMDEADFDGIHVTVGRIHKLPKFFSLAGEIVVRGSRFPLEINQLEGVKVLSNEEIGEPFFLLSRRIKGRGQEVNESLCSLDIEDGPSDDLVKEWLAKVTPHASYRYRFKSVAASKDKMEESVTPDLGVTLSPVPDSPESGVRGEEIK